MLILLLHKFHTRCAGGGDTEGREVSLQLKGQHRRYKMQCSGWMEEDGAIDQVRILNK